MRQFILGGNVAYPSSAKDLNALANGSIGVFYDKDGVMTITSTGKELTNFGNIVLGRTVELGGPILFPISRNNFSYTKSEYKAASKFKATVTITKPTLVGTYSIILVKKGKLFNDRANYTADVYVPNTDETAAKLAEKLTKQINNNTIANGVKATVSGATITIEAVNEGEDYAILGADNLQGVEVTVVSNGMKAFNDAAYITDLACKAAADAGFEYTFEEDVKMYNGYPLNPLAQDDKEDTGFTVFTLRFAEPREVKTRDEVVNQIVQIALPTGAAAISSLETIFKELAGETTTTASTASIKD